MTFLAPLGLLALLAIPVIVLLHFRRERLRRVIVPSLMLWQHLEVVSGQQRKLRLPLTLLLLLHLLVAFLLALALSQPEWLSNLLRSGERHYVVVVDTSTSMGAQESPIATRLDQARDQVRNLISGLGVNDTLSLISANTQAQLLITGGSANRANLLAATDQLTASGTGTDLNGALTLANVVREQASVPADPANRQIVIVSDLDPPQELALPPEQVQWVRVGGATNNQAIVVLSAQARRAGTPGYDVYIRVTNYDLQPAFTTISLYGDDELLNTRQLDLEASGEAELTWDLPADIALLRAEIDSNDALPIDNTALLSLEQSRSLNTLVVSDNPAPLTRALDAIDRLEVEVISPADYNTQIAAPVDLTIVDGAQLTSWPTGSVLWINPPSGSQNELLTVSPAPSAESSVAGSSFRLVEEVGTLNPLEGINLRGVDFGPLSQPVTPDWARPLALLDETPLILRGRTGASEVAVWAFDLRNGNLVSRLAYPLLMARTVQDLTTPQLLASLTLGQQLQIEPDPRTEQVEVIGPDTETRTFSVSDTLAIDGLRQPGLYRLVELVAETPINEGYVTVNAGTPRESDLRPRLMPLTDPPYLANIGTTTDPAATTVPEQQNQQHPLWPWLTIAALVIISLEWIYVHWR